MRMLRHTLIAERAVIFYSSAVIDFTGCEVWQLYLVMPPLFTHCKVLTRYLITSPSVLSRRESFTAGLT